MNVLLAVRCPKVVTRDGRWNTGKMPNNAFPLSKSKSYALGSAWSWQVLEAEGAGQTFRILVAIDVGRSQYQAWLGLIDKADQALLARLEHHPTHRGWHLHLRLGDIAGVGRGMVKESKERERCRLCHAKPAFEVTQMTATAIALKAFCVSNASLRLS